MYTELTKMKWHIVISNAIRHVAPISKSNCNSAQVIIKWIQWCIFSFIINLSIFFQI